MNRLPQSPEAEEAVLTCLLVSPIETLALFHDRGIDSRHFVSPVNYEVVEAVKRLAADSKPVDAMSVAIALKDAGRLDAVGGLPRITSLATGLAVHTGHYIEVLQKKANLRAIIGVGNRFASKCYEEDADPVSLLDAMQGELSAVTTKRTTRPTVADIIAEIVEEVQNGRQDVGLLPIAMDGIKGRLKLYRGDLLMVTAPTSCGKTALAAQMTFDQAVQGRRVAMYPLEMKQKQMLKRAIAQLGGNNADFVRTIVASGKDPTPHTTKILEEFIATAGSIMRFPMHIRDDLFTLDAILADLRAEHAKKAFDFVMIDYLQLVATTQRFERKQLQIAHITQTLKRSASEMNLVFCVPSQVNKQGGTREAEDAENDASALIKIHPARDKDGNPLEDVAPGRVEVWKQREGERHVDLPLTFNGRFVRFEEKN